MGLAFFAAFTNSTKVMSVSINSEKSLRD